MSYAVEKQLAEVAKTIKKILSVAELPAIEIANSKFDADFALPCFTLARDLHKKPQEIAEQIVVGLNHPVIAKAEAKAGFVNLWLSDSALGSALGEIVTKPTYGAQKLLDKQKILIEVYSTNPFKDLHIGHAYNSIVGDTLANIFKLGGADLHRVSYGGDVGLHVGKSMWAILRYLEGDISKLDVVKSGDRPAFLSRMYVEGAGQYEEDSIIRQQIDVLARQSFVQDDAFFKQVYEICRQWSFDYIHKMIKKMGSQLAEREYWENEADKLGRQIVETHIGDVFERSEGAIVFKGETYGLHTRVFITSHDTTLYEARDLGLMQLKEQEYNPDKSYYLTAEEQRDYFKVVLKAAQLSLPELKDKSVNISTGTVKLSTGKMSSRTGKVVNIEGLFKELSEALKARGAEEDNLQAGIVGALRYAMLKVRIGGDIIFDINESISLEGNSGPYLQYAHARGRSILAKLADSSSTEKSSSSSSHPRLDWESSKKKSSLLTGSPIGVGDDETGEKTFVDFTADEHKLAIKVLEYPTITAKAISELAPHHICNYLYELTQQFNRFYEHNRIIGDPRQNQRAELVNSYCQVLENGLGVLGIPAPERL
ncbi:MAG TPA: arginine--tRNA ligase [Patescibacteria group bacterium]|jgi:arginyl-tRNA synthetase|nr:arginine--tRNA ligase [Patescibacteria group bacterium]